jgi:hypothetical protein
MGARDLLADAAGAGLTIAADGDRLVIRPASMLTQTMREALRQAKPELLALLRGTQPDPGPADLDAVAWSDSDMARFHDRRARLLRWRWPEADAERWAARLVQRDRDADPRVSCADCGAYRPGRCGNHEPAGLLLPEVGRDWVALLQRCPGFQTAR